MAVEKKFVQKAVDRQLVKEFLEKELRNAGVSSISIQKTPLATRIAIRVRRPSVVIGKKGSNVKTISERLEKDYRIENPQLDVIEVEKPELDAKLAAERIARQIEIEGNIKQTMRFNLRDIMNAGAQGAEIIVAGKVVGKGGKAKSLRMRMGFLKKAGEVKKLVKTAKYTAYLKAGAIGVKVRIVLPETQFPDAVRIDYAALEKRGLGEATGEAREEGMKKQEENAEAKAAEEMARQKIEKAQADAREKERRAKRKMVRKPKAAQGVPHSGHEPQLLTGRDEPPSPAKPASPAPEKMKADKAAGEHAEEKKGEENQSEEGK